eukprot:1143745-Pelagomonas_calceolata.AAC.1
MIVKLVMAEQWRKTVDAAADGADAGELACAESSVEDLKSSNAFENSKHWYSWGCKNMWESEMAIFEEIGCMSKKEGPYGL